MADLSIIVPALNEAANLTPLAKRVDAALRGRDYELLIVDDNSPDATPEVCAALSRQFPLRLIVREHPEAGLSGAVLAGMREATGDFLVVMDADLQHPPEKIPDMLRLLEQGDADFVIGSRYVAGGTTRQQWGALRRLNSHIATWLARPFSGPVRDPMSGFFALRRATYARADRLMPLGYKIGLELMSKCRVQKVAEVPIEFGLRAQGQSKLTMGEQFRYLEHLSRLYDFSYPRLSPVVKFLIVLALSWVFGGAVAWILWQSGLAIAGTVTLSYAAAIAVTALFHARYVRTQRQFLVRATPWLDFMLISAGEWITCAAAALYLSNRLAQPRLVEVFLLAFAAATVTRYLLRKELLQDIRGLRRIRRTP